MTIIIHSCNKTTPAGFWKRYKSDLLKENISDQGPSGGHRALYWKAGKKNTFIPKNIIEFATRNGWTFLDSLEFNQNETNKWTYGKNPIFPLSNTGFSNTATNNSTYQYFPRWFGGNIKVYKFKTGWVTIEPGTDHSIEDNGFALINNDMSEFAVYHLWGE